MNQDVEMHLPKLLERHLLLAEMKKAVTPQISPSVVSNPLKTQDFEDLSSKKTREAGLSNIERLAKRDMKVVAYSTSYPADMTAISDWSKSLNEKGITLVPLTFAQNYQAIQEPEKPANDPKAH